MNELLTAAHVILGLDAATREDVFRTVAQAAERDGVTDSQDALYGGLMSREDEVSTGLMDGYAIPHTKTDAARRAAMYYVRTNSPIPWETMDGSDVTNFFVLIAPASDQNDTHLMMLSALATCLLEDEFKEAVAGAETPQEVVSLVSEGIEKERGQQ